MDETSKNLWYQLGYALEQARSQPSRDRIESLAGKLAAFRKGGQGETRPTRRKGSASPTRGPGGAETLDWLLASFSGALVARVLRGWKPRRRPGPYLLLRSAAAGAAAMIFQELAHALFSEDPGEVARRSRALSQRLLSGTARGVLYGAVAEPRLPGPPVVRGVLYGTTEYLLSPVGGLGKLLGKEAPYSGLPGIRVLLEEVDGEEDGYLEHLVFGLALSLMAGETRRVPRVYLNGD